MKHKRIKGGAISLDQFIAMSPEQKMKVPLGERRRLQAESSQRAQETIDRRNREIEEAKRKAQQGKANQSELNLIDSERRRLEDREKDLKGTDDRMRKLYPQWDHMTPEQKKLATLNRFVIQGNMAGNNPFLKTMLEAGTDPYIRPAIDAITTVIKDGLPKVLKGDFTAVKDAVAPLVDSFLMGRNLPNSDIVSGVAHMISGKGVHNDHLKRKKVTNHKRLIRK